MANDYTKEEQEFYHLSAERKKALDYAKAWMMIDRVPNEQALRSAEFYAARMTEHPYWSQWKEQNREAAYNLEREVREARERQEKREQAKGKSPGKEPGRGREPDI